MSKESFEWDPEKDLLNRAKHGVSFVEAQEAFFDARRVIAEDISHSGSEKRYYCFGKVPGGILICPIYISRRCNSDHWRRLLAKRQEDL